MQTTFCIYWKRSLQNYLYANIIQSENGSFSTFIFRQWFYKQGWNKKNWKTFYYTKILIFCFKNFTMIVKIFWLSILLFSLKVFSNDFQNWNVIHKYLVHVKPSLKAGLGVGIHLIHPGLALGLKPPYLFFQLGPCLPIYGAGDCVG
jgi:hypothetical protein